MSQFSRHSDARSLSRVNRYILILTPLQPYVDWVRGLPKPEGTGGLEFSLDEAQRHHQASYLVPYAWEWSAVEAWCDANYDLFFENELRQFEEDTDLWPAVRTLDVFEAWFEVQVVDAPFDTTREPMFLSPPGEEADLVE